MLYKGSISFKIYLYHWMILFLMKKFWSFWSFWSFCCYNTYLKQRLCGFWLLRSSQLSTICQHPRPLRRWCLGLAFQTELFSCSFQTSSSYPNNRWLLYLRKWVPSIFFPLPNWLRGCTGTGHQKSWRLVQNKNRRYTLSQPCTWLNVAYTCGWVCIRGHQECRVYSCECQFICSGNSYPESS